MSFPLAISVSQVNMFNANVLLGLTVGDVVEFPRGLFSHYGIYIGESKIVHVSGKWITSYGCTYSIPFVIVENFWDVVGNSLAKKNNDKDMVWKPFSPSTIKDRALSRQEPIPYNVFSNNCEHFAAWCRYGKSWSKQADTALYWTVGLGAAVVVGGLIYAAINGGNDEKK